MNALDRNALWRDQKVVARFWKYTSRAEGCWPWTGPLKRNGYGQLQVQRSLNRKFVRAHCLSWQIANQMDWPDGMLGRHSCDNPICVNPAHIEPGTPADNSADCVRRGRSWALGKHNRQKTHCKRGHPFSGENLRFNVNGSRACRACYRIYAARKGANNE